VVCVAVAVVVAPVLVVVAATALAAVVGAAVCDAADLFDCVVALCCFFVC